tara:strand:+ start:14641 stop:16416 length:1776 start_codon:yes stop_codon:yes gene_type:complete
MYASLNILFNIFSIIFSLVSLTMVIPFLGILFDETSRVDRAPDLAFNADSIKDNFYYLISKTVQDKGEVDTLALICILIVVTFFLKNLFRYLALFFLIPIRNGIVHNIRVDLHKKMLSLSMPFFTEKRKGDLTSRLTSDLVEIEWSIMSSIEMIFKDPIQIFIYLTTLIIISPKLTLFVIILFPITGIIIAAIGKSLKRTSDKGQKKMGFLLSIIDENLSGLKIIKAFNAENQINKNFNKNSSEYKKIMTSLLRKKDLSSPLSEFLSTIVLAIVMWFGGQIVLNGDNLMSGQEFIGYILIFSQIIPPARSLTSSYYHIQKGSAAAQRIYEILDEKNTIKDSINAKSINSVQNKITYTNVSFKYQSLNVLNGIYFEILKGQKVALVGQSGSGKTTIADLLARFYDIENGKIFIDNINIKDIKKSNLRNIMGIVNQDSILFNDTIYNNIKLSNQSAKKEDIINAAKVANAHDFILKTENGYNTIIGDQGNKLSGGQKQRLSIARAVLKNPDILILDEATSSLDTESEKLVQESLENLMKSRTSLIIAHRLSTIKNADKIIVLDKGKVVEEGTHDNLIKKKGHYKKLYDLQSFN